MKTSFPVRLRPSSLFVFLCGFVLFAGRSSAQWATESYTIKTGWNAIWLSIDCATQNRDITSVLSTYPAITEVWQWNAGASTTQFTESPQDPVQGDSQWKTWIRNDSGRTNLGSLTGNAGYLVRATTNVTLTLTGRPLPPDYHWKSSGVNFFGFPMSATASPPTQSFTNFLAHSPALSTDPAIFHYDGGEPVNPRLIAATNTAVPIRGKAYWIKSTNYSDYYGPLRVTVGSGGLNFGDTGALETVRIKNVTAATVLARLTMVASAIPPGESAVPEMVPLKRQGEIDTVTLQPVLTDLPVEIEIAAGKEEVVRLLVDRTRMNRQPGYVFQSLLQVTDSTGFSRIDLPVRAVQTSLKGVWAGAAVLNSVERVTTRLGDEKPAPLGATDTPASGDPAAEKTVTTTVVTETVTSAESVRSTTRTTTINPVTFDAAARAFDLPGPGIDTATLIPGAGGPTEYVKGTDYEIEASSRLTVTNGGSGYTSAPAVDLVGGVDLDVAGNSKATAEAEITGSVTSVKIDAAGSDYTSAPNITLTGGGGSGATAIAIMADGIVTEIRVTNGGAGYTSPPVVDLTGGGGSGASASAVITGKVTAVTLTGRGSGYTAPPNVVFSTGGGSGAAATSYLVAGSVTGVSSIHWLQGGPLPDQAKLEFKVFSTPDAATPDGTSTFKSTSGSTEIVQNGKIYTSTTTRETGSGAAAPSNFPVRLVLHAGSDTTLAQQIYLGARTTDADPDDDAPPVTELFAGLAEAAVKAVATEKMGRLSSASFPRGGSWKAASGTFGGTDGLTFNVVLGYNEASNPFVHSYHPDHDNYDARYERTLPEGAESFTVTREIKLTFNPQRPAGSSDLTWGTTTLGGTYEETITGLRAQAIRLKGAFILHRVSEASTLLTNQP